MEERIRSNRRMIFCGTIVYLAMIVGIGGLFAYWILSISHTILAWISLSIYVLLTCFAIYIAIHGGLNFILWLCKATPITDIDEFNAIRSAVEDVSIATGIEAPELLLIDVDCCNTFSLNIGDYGAIIFTRGLTKTLNQDELRAVMAHEMAHIYNEDVALNTFVASIRGFSLIINLLLQRLSDSNVPYEMEAGIALTVKILLLGVTGFLFLVLYTLSASKIITYPTWLVMTLILLFSVLVNLFCITIFSYVMQRLIDPSREMIADELCAKWTMDPEALVTAIEKVSRYSAIYGLKFLKAAFFIPPYFTDTQPTPQERIRYLQNTLHIKLETHE
jgi:Zn-dependent protease with chaperone function